MAKRAIVKPIVENTGGRVRGPNLRVFIKASEGAHFIKALELANKENLVLASNKRLTRALIETGEWASMGGTFACWTGTLVAYAKPGQKLGESIRFSDPLDGKAYVFPVPGPYRQEKDAILVVEHPNYILAPERGRFLVEASNVECILRFPRRDGWYLAEGKHEIPSGKESGPSDPCARQLWRAESMVGPIPRFISFDWNYKRSIMLNFGFFPHFAAVAEAP